MAASFGVLALMLFIALALLAGKLARRDSLRASEALLGHVAEAMADRLDADMANRFHEIGRLAASESALRVEMTPTRWRSLLAELQRTMEDYSWIGVADADGIVIAATGGLLEGRSVAERPWFQRGRERPVVLGVHEAKLLDAVLPAQVAGEPYRFVDAAAPLHAGGQFAGVIGAHLNWKWAEQQRRNVLAGFGRDMSLDLRLVGPGGDTLLGTAAPAADGGFLVASRPSRAQGSYPGMGWTVEVRQPVAVALAGADALQRVLLALALAGSAVFACAGWWLSGALTLRLRDAARRARAQAGAGVSSADQDEVSQLSASLSALADGLQQRETELRHMNARFDQQVATRTSALSEQNERLRGFTRNVSHDLRGPLGQMALLLERLLDKEGAAMTAEAQRKVGMVAMECARLSRLTDELMSLAMVDQRPLAVEPVDHARLVQEVLGSLEPDPGREVPAVDIGPLPVLTGDPVLLRQLWTNLLSNALKYTRKSEHPRVEVGAARGDDGWQFTVSDNGIGFDPAQAGRLFGAFERLHSDPEFEGSGIGLTIVQRVVERHRGRVWAEGSPGAGARFHFVLPA